MMSLENFKLKVCFGIESLKGNYILTEIPSLNLLFGGIFLIPKSMSLAQVSSPIFFPGFPLKLSCSNFNLFTTFLNWKINYTK